MAEPGLRLFLDSADVGEWSRWLPVGLFRGVTTNPLLLQRAGEPCTEQRLGVLARQAFDLGAREVQLQTWGGGVETLAARGQRLAALDPRVVVKVPVTRPGTEAAAQLVAAGVPVTLTAVYAVHQVLVAAALGAAYAAPYLGRMNDAGRDGRGEVAAMQALLRTAGDGAPRLLVASLRRVEELTVLARAGCDTFTFSAALAEALFREPLTEEAAAAFEALAAGTHGEEDQ